ncbi:MAG: ribonuclease HI family protein [Candidatus Paceibacterota bacterium]
MTSAAAAAAVSSPPPPTEKVLLRFDGSSMGNPGPSGCGYALFRMDGTLIASGGRSLGVSTNNVAEYRGLCEGCLFAHGLGYKRIAIEGDSLLVCSQVSGKWKIKADHLRPLRDEAKRCLSLFDEWSLVHARRSFNSVADDMAKRYATT